MKLTFFRNGVLLMVCVLPLLPAGCGQKKEELPANEGGKENGKPVDPLAEAKEQSKKNLKQIGKALHGYHDSRFYYPVGILNPETKKMGLSWRVQILPYLEDAQAMEVYNKIRQDEPWDSEHNKKLVAEMPKVFAPVHGQVPPGHTFYQGIAAHIVEPGGKELSPNAKVPPLTHVFIFPDPRSQFPVSAKAFPNSGLHVSGPRISGVSDGSSNTILLAEAGEAVPWTKPQDIPFPLVFNNPMPDNKYLPKLGGMFGGDFHILMADGTNVYYVKKNPPPEKLLPFITPADGFMVDWKGIGLPVPE